MGMFNSKGNMFLETERPEQKRTLCGRTHGQAAGRVVPAGGRRIRVRVLSPHIPCIAGVGQTITHCAVANHGLFWEFSALPAPTEEGTG